MTDQPTPTTDDPTRRTFQVTPALVRDVALILVQQGWEMKLSSAIPQAQQILERVKEDVDAQGLVLVPKEERLCFSEPTADGGRACDHCEIKWLDGEAWSCVREETFDDGA